MFCGTQLDLNWEDSVCHQEVYSKTVLYSAFGIICQFMYFSINHLKEISIQFFIF